MVRTLSGFTLLEVMVAVAILAIALVTLLGSQSRSLSVAGISRFETRAALLARDRFSRFLLQDPDRLAPDEGDFGEEAPGFRWRLETRNLDGEEAGIEGLETGLTELTLTITAGEQSYTSRCLVMGRIHPERR